MLKRKPVDKKEGFYKMKTVSKRLLSLTAFLLSVSLFAVSAEALGDPQTSVSNSGEEFDAHQNQPVQTTQTSPLMKERASPKDSLHKTAKLTSSH